MKDNEVNLYKDGNVFGIDTSCKDEGYFLDAVSEKLSDLIDKEMFRDDWSFQLRGWLPEVVNICYEYRREKRYSPGRTFGSGNTSEENLVR